MNTYKIFSSQNSDVQFCKKNMCDIHYMINKYVIKILLYFTRFLVIYQIHFYWLL